MSALDAFYSTWSKARATFGEGVPNDGAQFDQSRNLTQLKAGVEAAAPDDRWQGTAAAAYGTANKDHAQVFQKLADLDQRMVAEVRNAATVVSAGRENLNTTRGWVESMVSSLPATSAQDRERKLIPIANAGISRVENIVTSATTEMTVIKGNVEKLRGEYDTVKNTMRFGPEQKPGDERDGAQKLSGEDEEKDGEDKDDVPGMHPPSVEEQARMDVEDALSEGDGGAAQRVDDLLASIKPGEQLSPEQDAYLSEMQRQQKGMSVEDLAAAEQRLGDRRNIIADSWQLMSNDDVRYAGGAGDEKKGAASQLPDSVQEALNNADSTWSIGDGLGELRYEKDLNAIAEIVKNGDAKFQTGTELDRQLIVAADKAMDVVSMPGAEILGRESTVQSLFEAVDDDHQIINDHLMGRNGVDVNDFLHDVNTTDWPDNGKAAGYLFGWTNPGEGGFASEAEQLLATQVADRYAEYLGANRPILMDINGQTLGQLNPELVQRYAHGLVPFVDDMGGLTGSNDFKIDELESRRAGLMPNAKGVFALLNTDSTAANIINAEAFELAMQNEAAFALNPKDPMAQQYLEAAATMRGLVDVGAHEAFQAFEANGYQAGVDETQWKKAGFDTAVGIVSEGASLIPGYGLVAGPVVTQVGSIFSQDVFDSGPAPVERPLPQMAEPIAGTVILDAMLAAGHVPQLPDGYVAGDPPRIAQPDGVSDSVFNTTINSYLGDHTALVNGDGPDEMYAERYNLVIQDPDIQKTPDKGDDE